MLIKHNYASAVSSPSTETVKRLTNLPYQLINPVAYFVKTIKLIKL